MTTDIEQRATLTREVRDWNVEQVELRDRDGRLTFEGLASATGVPYPVRDTWGEFSETVAPGSFKRTLKMQDDVKMLVNHAGVPIARTKSGTLRLAESDEGLRVSADLDVSNPTVAEVRSAVERGDLDQMSIGMRVHKQEWNEDYSERLIREIQLVDVSVVAFPANPHTTASIRSLIEQAGEIDDPDEIRRAIAALEARLGILEPVLPSRDYLSEWMAKRYAA